MSKLKTKLHLLPLGILFTLLTWQGEMMGVSNPPYRRFRIMTYNVENLFDTLHAEGKLDEEFTPLGSRKWDSRKYWRKQGQLCRVIAGVGGIAPADLVALVEVENDSVIAHLTERTKLRRLGYQYVITHGEDLRGINVALLYQPHRFKLCQQDSLRVPPISNKQRQTRDVLHIAGELVTGDTLDLFICHLPSRREERMAERYRERIMQRLRTYTDSLFRTRQKPSIILTGDFNAWYPERCFTRDLNVLLTPGTTPHPSSGTENGKTTLVPDTLTAFSPHRLYLLTYKKEARNHIRGTYKFQGEWNQLDHFIISGNLLDHATQTPPITPFTTVHNCRIVDFPFLLKNEKNSEGVRPYRTFLGTFHQGGYSDHLPLILDLYY